VDTVTNDLQQVLEAFLRRTGALAAAVAHVESGQVWSAGDTSAEAVRWLYASEFGSAESVWNLHAALANMILPQMSSQGVVTGALSRSAAWVYGVYYPDEYSDPLDSYVRAEALSADLWRSVEPLLPSLQPGR
jgi:hypothetical protein